MNPVIAFLRAVRIENLLIIALTEYMMRWCIILPLLKNFGKNIGAEFVLQMSELDFFLLSLSTVLIAGAGYIINDYFDLKIDRINKPDKIIIGRHIKRRVAMGAHVVINFLGLALGAYISFKYNMLNFLFIHVFAIGGLWFYATTFKRQFLVGNIVIALLAAIIPFIAGLYELPLLAKAYSQQLFEVNLTLKPILYWLAAYCGFAFIMTLAREITKDIVDIKGDKMYGCSTLPIQLGQKNAQYFIAAIYLITISAIGYIYYNFLNDKITLLYFSLLLILPLLYTSFRVISGRSSKHFKTAALLNKLVSLFGILYAGVVYYILTFHLFK